MERTRLRPPLRPGEPSPWIVAHRGNSAAAPENTAPAFEAALAAPIDAIELDVQMSADGVPVIHHDATVAKLGGGRRRVSAVPWRELRTLDAGGWKSRRFRGERLITLPELLDRWGPRTWWLIEIKARGGDRDADWHRRLTERVVDDVRRRGLGEQVLLLCFDEQVLAAARRHDPRIATVRNLAAVPKHEARLRDLLEPLHAVSVDVRALTRRFVDAAHSLGKPVFSYTCNRPATVTRALMAGADGVMADDPVKLAPRVRPRIGATR